MMVELTALILGFGIAASWVIKVDRENKRLRSDLKLAREIMREAIEERDKTVAELRESNAQKYEMQLELDSYGESEKTREEFRKLFGKALYS